MARDLVNSGTVAIVADPVRKLCVPTITSATELLESLSRLLRVLSKSLIGLRVPFLDLPSTREVVCERRDSNPDLVKDRNLNPVDWQ